MGKTKNHTGVNKTMNVIELPLDINCVAHWSIEDAIRELLQNAIDRGEYETQTNSCGLRIISKNTLLPVDSLVIGKTTKGINDIGGFGEGYKMAIVVLLRNHIPISVITDQHKWEFYFGHSSTFGCKILRVKILTQTRADDRNTEFILDVDPKITNPILHKLVMSNRNFYDSNEIINTNKGQIILNPDNPGDIFINGLYISNNKKFKYGYNFNPGVLHLDRDRKIIETYELSKITSSIWAEVAQRGGHGEKIGELVYSEAFDVDSLGYHELPPELADGINESFESKNGERSAPYYFDSDREKYENEYRNLHPVYTPNNTTNCIEFSPRFKQKLKENELREDEKLSPYNLLTKIYNVIRPFLTSDLQAKFVDIINQSKQWR